jgi:hypothetical protein
MLKFPYLSLSLPIDSIIISFLWSKNFFKVLFIFKRITIIIIIIVANLELIRFIVSYLKAPPINFHTGQNYKHLPFE